MAKTGIQKVFVKYIQHPGMVERVIIGPHPGRCFYADPKFQDAELGDLVDVDFVMKYRTQFETAGFLIFDEKGMQKSVDEISGKEIRKQARTAAKAGSDAATKAAEKTESGDGTPETGEGKQVAGSLVPTLKEFVEAGYKAEHYERRFFGLRVGDPFNEIVVMENLVKAGKASEEDKKWLEEARKRIADEQLSL